MKDYEKLKEIIDEIDTLIAHHVTKLAPAFTAWHMKAERFLTKKYGVDSLELSNFQKTRFSPVVYTENSELVAGCRRDLTATKLVFSEYLKELDEISAAPSIQTSTAYDKVFIVHGHDGELKEAVARIMEKQNIEAIILSEKANQGKTIIEKFEQYSDVSGAICLFTADDFGRAKTNSSDNVRARQNVVLETGYFMGKLGRGHVVLLADKGIEMPSDLSGVVYTNTASWQFDVLKELNAMGYKVDLNKLL